MKTGRDIILEYCKNVSTNDIDYLQGCNDVVLSLEREGVNYHFDHCPSSYGIDNFFDGDCSEHEVDEKEQDDQCKRCWERALSMEVTKEMIISSVKYKSIEKITNSEMIDEVEEAINILVKRMNELERDTNKKHYLGTIEDKGKSPVVINWD